MITAQFYLFFPCPWEGIEKFVLAVARIVLLISLNVVKTHLKKVGVLSWCWLLNKNLVYKKDKLALSSENQSGLIFKTNSSWSVLYTIGNEKLIFYKQFDGSWYMFINDMY